MNNIINNLLPKKRFPYWILILFIFAIIVGGIYLFKTEYPTWKKQNDIRRKNEMINIASEVMKKELLVEIEGKKYTLWEIADINLYQAIKKELINSTL